MMHVARDGIELCEDCMIVAVNGDYTGITVRRKLTDSDEDHEARLDRRIKRIDDGLAELGPHLVPNFDSETGEGINEHSRGSCDCCGSSLHGARHEFAVLAKGPDPLASSEQYEQNE